VLVFLLLTAIDIAIHKYGSDAIEKLLNRNQIENLSVHKNGKIHALNEFLSESDRESKKNLESRRPIHNSSILVESESNTTFFITLA